MKIGCDDIGVFKVKVSHENGVAWLLDAAVDLVEVNSAIDEAVSFAADNGRAFVLIEITKDNGSQ